uniref:Ig-like domain-containing protein n=1 Tax=Chelydra serpentina TaxID=8475 RepID=A0A8C3XMA2_CHESE
MDRREEGPRGRGRACWRVWLLVFSLELAWEEEGRGADRVWPPCPIWSCGVKCREPPGWGLSSLPPKRVQQRGPGCTDKLWLGCVPGISNKPSVLLLSPLPLGRFVFQFKADCQFTNGTERVRYLGWYIYNQQQFVHFDSDVGVWVGDTEVGRRWAEGWNKDKAEMDYRRSEVDTFCRHNYGVYGSFTVARRVQPKVKVSPTQSGSQPHPHLLVCSVTGFYPGGIEIKWLKNGQEQTVGVVSTELLQNGDWTFQILVMLEMRPRRGDIYTCQVEHVSLRDPITVRWGAPAADAGGRQPPCAPPVPPSLRSGSAAPGTIQTQSCPGPRGLV